MGHVIKMLSGSVMSLTVTNDAADIPLVFIDILVCSSSSYPVFGCC